MTRTINHEWNEFTQAVEETMKQVTINYASGAVEVHTDVVRVVGRGYHKITGYRADGSEAFSVLPAGATVSEIDTELEG